MDDLWGVAMVDAFRDMMVRIAAMLPRLLALVSFLVIGLLASLFIKAVLQRLLMALRVDALSERWGIHTALARAGLKRPLSQIAGRLAFWLVFVIFIFMGVDSLNLPATAVLMGQVLGFLPSVVAASLLLLVGILLANFFAEATLIATVNAQIQEARLIANLVRWGVMLFTAAMVLTQLGIATEIVVAAFSILFGGVVLALALAVGLGARHIAREALERRWRGQKEEERDEIAHL